jgi:amino acid transporter
MFETVSRVVFGSPLPSAAEAEQRLSKTKALAIFASDALSSVAYATEEILIVLVAAGSAALGMSPFVAMAIAALLVIVAVSYYQTVHGYPQGGGAYTVAYENLGMWYGLAAASALMISYVLTVAVSVSAGIAATSSAFPALYPYRVYLCLAAIAFITWANLRGVRESGTLFAVPTYAFVALLFALIGVGALRAVGALPAVAAVVPTSSSVGAAQPLTLFLFLRAFSSGCAALTGVEAISNGVTAFRRPEADNAGKTLIAMAALLAAMFLGITFLADALQVVPLEEETVVSQLGRHVFGQGPLYLALQAATMLILILAANTSFAGFPRLAAILARERYLPRQFANLGDRLVFDSGILALAAVACALIVFFGGETHRLIPLYAFGVFMAFTLSQAGMVRHWRREKGRGWQWKAIANGIGALSTGVVLAVIVATKFLLGAWIVLLLIPAFVWMLHTIRRHYLTLAAQLSLEGLTCERWEGLSTDSWHKVVVLISGIHRGTLGALRFARSLSTDVTAVTVDVEPEVTARIRQRWPTWGCGIPLVELSSPYRSTLRPLLAYLEQTDARDPERGPAVVVLPEFVPARWWHHLLHNRTAALIRRAIIYQRGHGGVDRVVINVPYHLQR